MSFARKYMDLKEDLRAEETELLERKKQKEQLEAEIRVSESRKQAIEREIYATTLAINTIQEISREYVDKWNYIINDHMADIMQRVTGGLYDDAKINEKFRLMVRRNGVFTDITQITAEDFPLVRLAVRVGIAARMCRENMPLIIDGLPRMNDAQMQGFFASLEKISSEQILVLTDDKQLVSKLKDTKSTYALTNLG